MEKSEDQEEIVRGLAEDFSVAFLKLEKAKKKFGPKIVEEVQKKIELIQIKKPFDDQEKVNSIISSNNNSSDQNSDEEERKSNQSDNSMITTVDKKELELNQIITFINGRKIKPGDQIKSDELKNLFEKQNSLNTYSSIPMDACNFSIIESQEIFMKNDGVYLLISTSSSKINEQEINNYLLFKYVENNPSLLQYIKYSNEKINTQSFKNNVFYSLSELFNKIKDLN